jgi:hypothetical protein
MSEIVVNCISDKLILSTIKSGIAASNINQKYGTPITARRPAERLVKKLCFLAIANVLNEFLMNLKFS